MGLPKPGQGEASTIIWEGSLYPALTCWAPWLGGAQAIGSREPAMRPWADTGWTREAHVGHVAVPRDRVGTRVQGPGGVPGVPVSLGVSGLVLPAAG